MKRPINPARWIIMWAVLGAAPFLFWTTESLAQPTSPQPSTSQPSGVAQVKSAKSAPANLTSAEVPNEDRSDAPENKPDDQPENQVAVQRLAAKVQRLQDRLDPFAGENDLLESLYYPLFDRPYRRATIGVLLKTAQLLDAEVQSRRAGNPILADASVRSLLAWCESALKGIRHVHVMASPVRSPPVRRSKLNVKGRQLLLDGEPTFLLGWIDRSLARQQTPVGDLDLMACLGANIYAQPDVSANSLVTRIAVEEKCDQLGIGHVSFSGRAGIINEKSGASTIAIGLPHGGDPGSSDPGIPANKPLDLPVDVMTFLAPELGETLTVADTPIRALLKAVSWAGFKDRIVDSDLTATLLIRQTTSSSVPRPLMGLEWRITSSAGEVIPTPRQWRAAMWAQLFSGQRGGLFEGWKEPEPTDWLPNESLFLFPALLETQAHTGLDARRVAHVLAAFPEKAEVAILVGRDAVTAELGAWSKELIRLHNTLRDAQIAVDVCPLSMLRSRYPLRHYKAIVLFQVDGLGKKYFNRLASFAREGVKVISFGDSLREDDALRPAPDFRFALWAGIDQPINIANYLTELRANGGIEAGRVRITGANGSPIPGLRSWAGRLDNGRLCVGLVNLSGKPTGVTLQVPHGVRAGPWRDVLTGQSASANGAAIELDPLDVLLLEAVGPGSGAELAGGSPSNGSSPEESP